MACIDWDAGPVRPVRAEGYGIASSRPVRQRLAACRYFTLEYLCTSEAFAVGGTGRLQTLLVVQGRGRMARLDRPDVVTGDTIVLPATLPETTCIPDGSIGLLLATLPEDNSV
jgi:hypothetical protein